MEDTTLRIKERHMGGGDYVVGFDADLQFLSDTTMTEVELVSIAYGQENDPNGVAASEAMEYIRQGIEDVLLPRGLGAYVMVSNLVIHPTDFRAYKHRRFAKEYLEAALK